jgi:hypothetical protein
MIRGSRASNLTGNSVGVPSAACIRWPWLSHSPGMIVIPDASMTMTPDGTPSCPMRPTLAIVSPTIRTTASSIGSPPNPSTRRPPVIASVTPGGAARDGCGDRASDGEPRISSDEVAIDNAIARVDERRNMKPPTDGTGGCDRRFPTRRTVARACKAAAQVLEAAIRSHFQIADAAACRPTCGLLSARWLGVPGGSDLLRALFESFVSS